MILLLLITQLAGADCDFSKIRANPWKVANNLTEKEKLAVAINAVSCKVYGNGQNKLPSGNSEITDRRLFVALNQIYKKLDDSGLLAYPDSTHSDGCDRSAPGEFSENGLTVKGRYTNKQDPVGYLTKILNASMLKIGTHYAKNFCFFFLTTKKPIPNEEYSQLRRGVIGLLIKKDIIKSSTGYLF